MFAFRGQALLGKLVLVVASRLILIAQLCQHSRHPRHRWRGWSAQEGLLRPRGSYLWPERLLQERLEGAVVGVRGAQGYAC